MLLLLSWINVILRNRWQVFPCHCKICIVIVHIRASVTFSYLLKGLLSLHPLSGLLELQTLRSGSVQACSHVTDFNAFLSVRSQREILLVVKRLDPQKKALCIMSPSNLLIDKKNNKIVMKRRWKWNWCMRYFSVTEQVCKCDRWWMRQKFGVRGGD